MCNKQTCNLPETLEEKCVKCDHNLAMLKDQPCDYEDDEEMIEIAIYPKVNHEQ